jgi:hypothetical protein
MQLVHVYLLVILELDMDNVQLIAHPKINQVKVAFVIQIHLHTILHLHVNQKRNAMLVQVQQLQKIHAHVLDQIIQLVVDVHLRLHN